MVLELQGPKEVDSLEVKIGDGSYMIPLGTALTYKEFKALKSEDDILAFISKYMPEEVVEKLTISDLTQILKAWSAETERVANASVGES